VRPANGLVGRVDPRPRHRRDSLPLPLRHQHLLVATRDRAPHPAV